MPRSWACAYHYHQECCAFHKQQGRVPLHSALSLPQWPVAAVRTVAGRHDWPWWGQHNSIGLNWMGEALTGLTGDKKISISCELGVCYPSLLAMMNREDLHLRVSLRFCFYKYTFHLLCIICKYTTYIYYIYQLYTAYNILIYRLKYLNILTKTFWSTMYHLYVYYTYVVYIPSIYYLKYFDIQTKIFEYTN